MVSASLASLVWAVANLLLRNVLDFIPSVPGFLREPCDVALEMKRREKGEAPAPTLQELPVREGSRHLGFCLEPISLVQRMEPGFLHLQLPASSPAMEKSPPSVPRTSNLFL